MATTMVPTFTNPTASACNDSFLSGPGPLLASPASTRSTPSTTQPFRQVQANAPRRRRRITPQAGRAIEMLGHAIEYLADEYALDCMTRPERSLAGSARKAHPQIEAIELLKSKNREIYFSCPEEPTLGERLRALLRLQRA